MADLLSPQARAFLLAPRFAVLGTAFEDGRPQLTVMWYRLDGDEIMMNTAAGRVKDGNLRRDPRVAICVEDGYNYVTLYGNVTINDDQETAQRDIFELALRYRDAAYAEQIAANSFRKQQRVTLRVAIDRVDEHF